MSDLESQTSHVKISWEESQEVIHCQEYKTFQGLHDLINIQVHNV